MTLTFDPLTPKSIGCILDSLGVSVWSFITISQNVSDLWSGNKLLTPAHSTSERTEFCNSAKNVIHLMGSFSLHLCVPYYRRSRSRKTLVQRKHCMHSLKSLQLNFFLCISLYRNFKVYYLIIFCDKELSSPGSDTSTELSGKLQPHIWILPC